MRRAGRGSLFSLLVERTDRLVEPPPELFVADPPTRFNVGQSFADRFDEEVVLASGL